MRACAVEAPAQLNQIEVNLTMTGHLDWRCQIFDLMWGEIPVQIFFRVDLCLDLCEFAEMGVFVGSEL